MNGHGTLPLLSILIAFNVPSADDFGLDYRYIEKRYWIKMTTVTLVMHHGQQLTG